MNKQHLYPALLLLLLLAAALRFHRLDAQSFWNDEGNSARLSERSVQLIIEGTASDIHPPLYYLLLHAWRGPAGAGEFSLRAMSAFFGVGLVAVVVALGRALWRQPAPALLAGLLTAVNPALIYYSQETRMYELLAFLAALSTWLLWRWLAGRTWQLAAAYSLCLAAGLYTHYFFPAVLAAHGLLVLFWSLDNKAFIPNDSRGARSRTGPSDERFQGKLWDVFKTTAVWLLLLLAAGLLYLPWLPVFLKQVGGRPAERYGLGIFGQDVARWLSLGPTAGEVGGALFYLGWGILLLLALAGLRRVLWPAATLLLGWLLLPPAAMWLAGATRPAFFKFLLVAAAPLALLAGWGFWQGWQGVRGRTKGPGRLALLWLLGLLLWPTGRSMANLYTNPAFARADYRGLAARIAAEEHPNAGIILDAPNQWEVFTYYHRDGAPVYPLPLGAMDETTVAAELATIAATHDRLYAIFWGEAEQDPQRLVERWLDVHAFKARDEWVGDVRFVTYAVPSEPLTEMVTPLNLPFGEQITLLGYTLPETAVSPGDIAQLALFWQTTTLLNQRYKLFLHFLAEDGQLVAQRDSEPGGGLALTTTWQPGETIIDNHGLLVPLTAPPGRYTLLLGLYDINDPTARLLIETAAGPIDALPLAEIEVK